MNSAVVEVPFLAGLSAILVIYGIWRVNHATLGMVERGVTADVSSAPLIIRLGASVGRLIPSRLRPRGVSQDLEARLMLAGSPFGLSATEFTMISTGALVLGGIVGIACLLLLKLNLIFAMAAGGFIAYYPSLAVRSARKTRVRQVERELPYTTELLVMAIESGMQLRAALTEVTIQTAGVLVDEIKTVLSTINTGMSETDALTAMSMRLGMANVDHLVSALAGTHSSGVGTYLEHLKTQVGRLRRERMETADKKARSMMVKITIPLALFFLPAIGILLLGPGFTQIIHGLGGAGG